MICSKLLPFVSGITVKTNMAPAIENPENRNMLPCMPSVADSIGKYLTMKKASSHMILMQNDEPAFLIYAKCDEENRFNYCYVVF